MAVLKQMLVALVLSVLALGVAANRTIGVTYDSRSLIVNGKRELMFSGSIHYPRSTSDVS